MNTNEQDREGGAPRPAADRATSASPRAPTGLGHSGGIAGAGANISLLLADCRQALFDAVKDDGGASNSLRFEIGRAVGLMGLAMDATKAAGEMREALENMRRILRELQPALNVMAREVMDDIIADQIEPVLAKVRDGQ